MESPPKGTLTFSERDVERVSKGFRLLWRLLMALEAAADEKGGLMGLRAPWPAAGRGETRG